KLSFLTSISSSASVHGDELTQFMGDEISRIIQEQRDLERKYEERIAERGQLKGLCNKAKFMETQREIQDVAHKLKESNKSLCRNLKENPNVQGNLQKMQAERAQVQEWLEETKTDLMEMSFANLVAKVEAERREQERLSEVKRKEQKNSQAVKDLEDDLQRERSDHEKETKIANQEIKELKEELQKNKTISDIEYKFEEKKLRAREQALLRIHAQMEKKLVEEVEKLVDAQDMETAVHERAHAFLDQRIKHLYDENIAWTKDHEKEVDNRTVELDMLKERRAAAHTELAELEERRGLEADSYKEKENEMRNAVLIEKQRREQYQRMAEAVLFLQDEGRKYLGRLDARRAAMKGKKGKKGVDKARSLLDKLDLVVERLDSAKGITPLKAAIEAAETARLPEEIIVVGRERLVRREAAQQGLEEAIEAARVPDLLEALKVALLSCLPLPAISVLSSAHAQGEACVPGHSRCAAGLTCTCLALNRGLWVCQPPSFLEPPAYAAKYERQGLSCEARLPKGAKPLPPPPLLASASSMKIMDPRSGPAELKEWATGPGRGFYSQYLLVSPQDALLGIPVLAGPDVSAEFVQESAATVRHVLLEAAVSNKTMASLARTGIRLLIAAQETEDKDTWLEHPEVSRAFTTGLGGASPLFPSFGVHEGEAQVSVVEELFHTIQYCSLSPREVCMYRKAYKNAMEQHLYTTDHSAAEIDGEPVPTVQADEYLAMALQRWFGSHVGLDEYSVPGNTAHRSGRASLRKKDPRAFCILSNLFRANDTWDPAKDEPWTSYSNKANGNLKMDEVAGFCAPVLQELGSGCPSMDLPAEPEARERVELLGQTQGALQKAMSTKVIPDLSAALTLASKAGLKEHQMIHEARSLLSKLMNRRENVKKELEKAVKFRHPGKLKMTIMSARLAQVSLKRILDAEEVRKRVEELLEAMAEAAGIEEREKTLADAVAYSIPAELLKRFEIELEELKALHAAIHQGDPEVLRECIEKCEDLGIKVVELLEARVLYRDWASACQKIDVEASVQRLEPLRKAIKAAKDLGVNALVLARGNELLRHLEKRIRAEQELGEALKVRKLEIIAAAVRAAGDAGVYDHALVTKSHDMLEVLQTKRDKLQAASERAELHLMHQTMEAVGQTPTLPESETSRAYLKLRALRKKEQIQIVSRLKLAQEAKDFRTGDVLLERMVTARKADVDVDSQHVGSTEWMRLAEVEQRERIEKDILQERLSRKPMVLSEQAPESSASFIMSTGAIVGTMKVLFEPVGSQICILPREVVEANLTVNLEVGKGTPDSSKAVTPKKLQTLEGEATIRKCLGVIRKIIGNGDEVKCLRPIELSWEENARESSFRTLRGVMQVPIAIYIRRDHQCLEVADAICRRCHLGADLWQSPDLLPSSKIHPLDFCTDPNPVTEDCSAKLQADDTDQVVSTLSKELASSLVHVSRATTPLCTKQLADYTRSVHARVFRSLHLDFFWTYPKGIFDSLDASCLMFDQEKLLDIIDARGSQAAKYGISSSGPYGTSYERRSRSKDSPMHHSLKEKISAVSMFADEASYAESRQGKRTVEVRIDMIPAYVSDLIFVISPTNSRDLSKFTNLKSAVVDAESAEVLVSNDVADEVSPGYESAVLLSVYRLDDHLWHVNKIDAFCTGSHRDYRPVIRKVLSLGYPRQPAMKNLVPDVLKRIQAELSVPHPVKDTNVRVSRKNALEFGYAVELTGDQKMLSPEMLERIAEPMFIEALAETLYDVSSRRIGKSHLTISKASYGEAWNLEFEFKYKFPEQEDDTEEDSTHCYLDTTCVMFEGQALREVVDYRGAHGVRWVMNGVLDYRGYWVGQIPIGDASGGAVHHIGGSVEYAKREGRTACQVELDKLPAGVTDVFFVLSNHTTPVGAFSGVTLQVKDVNHPGHEVTGVFELAASDPKESALVACRCSRAPALETGLCEDTWTLDLMSISCGGHAMDYRPALQHLG
ncbi:DRC9, partial [Symbiodinium pilosum]